jgi:hypothetical protein
MEYKELERRSWSTKVLESLDKYDSKTGERINPRESVWIMDDDNKSYLALVSDFSTPDGKSVRAANLMAAAPTMLFALKRLVDERSESELSPSDWGYIESAIAKAEGRI